MPEETLTVRTEATPNPNSLKYNMGRMLLPAGSAYYPSRQMADGKSPLAEALFAVEGVAAVFIGSNFFTLTRADDGYDWNDLNQHIAPALEDWFDSGAPALSGEITPTAELPHVVESNAEKPVMAKVVELINAKVRPAVAMDGGDILFRGMKDGVVYLEMHGACSGCPSSSVTLKKGVEAMLQEHVPEVVEVVAV